MKVYIDGWHLPYRLLPVRARRRGESDESWDSYQKSLVEIEEDEYVRYLAHQEAINAWDDRLRELWNLSEEQEKP